MITPAEAEKLANEKIEEYLSQCVCVSTQDVSNALMKMVSMCGLGMCAVVGQEEAVERLRGTANHIAKPINIVSLKKVEKH